jgi:NADH:ubiquinone oxidoreductase subunit 4 (subunit M)
MPNDLGFFLRRVSGGETFVLAALTILLIWLGVYPAPLLNLIQTTMLGPN